MIKFKDLQNKIYDDKECVRFEYEIKADEKHKIIATFRRLKSGSAEWNMQVIFLRTRDKDSEVYNFGYVMPRSDLPLELIAATGLRYFQLYLKEEIQMKSNLDFEIGNIISGM